MEETISVRIPKHELKEIEFLSRVEKRKKSDVFREIIEKGIKEKKLEIALTKYRNNEATVSKAAQIADIPLTTFMDTLQKHNITFHYTSEDLKEDIEGI